MDMPSIDVERRILALEERVSVLGAENLALRSKVIELSEHGGRGRRIVPPLPEPVTRVTTPPPTSSFKMPDAGQLAQLSKIVTDLYPQFKCAPDQFALAFEAVGALKRTAEPDRKHYLSHHIAAATRLLHATGRHSVDIEGNAFLAACMAHGDVQVSGIGLVHSGYSIECGLNEYVGKDAGDSWRNVLQTKQLLPLARVAPRTEWNRYA
jgi:hypothetical protein